MSGSNTKMELSWDTKATARVIQFVLPYLKQKENTYLGFFSEAMFYSSFIFKMQYHSPRYPVDKSAEPLRIRNLKSFKECTNNDEKLD